MMFPEPTFDAARLCSAAIAEDALLWLDTFLLLRKYSYSHVAKKIPASKIHRRQYQNQKAALWSFVSATKARSGTTAATKRFAPDLYGKLDRIAYHVNTPTE